ncbi:MAG: hypothetical protein KJ583_02315 [Nanoarchaeota archaeon]|nr:hypothetical protein [Nanoarchaeota archaeon]MBU1269751.1 hypothetical protein [Nanoarchaeota archaeon]MBU1604129.1 hypothetical protein [Nanoarchaeota archaeon]MBU2443922.1 hypothetical protein [Nanoarchaeota archaeon]
MFLSFLTSHRKELSEDYIDFERDNYTYIFGENIRQLAIPYSEKKQEFLVRTVDGRPEPDYTYLNEISNHRTFYEITDDNSISYYPFNPMNGLR